jgi:hypothetical protein
MTTKKYLTRREAAQYLRDLGVPASPATLAKQATVGGGPDYALFGNKAIYTPAQLDAHVERKLKPRRSTSDA